MREEEEEEAVTSNGMNNDDKANINSRSDFDNNRIGDGDNNCNRNQISQVWGTWEELVLTCAVKRHGLSDWDSVAKEVKTRSRSSSLIAVSAGNCRLKYQDLKRRFQDSVDCGDGGERNSEAAEDGVAEITWIEKLRKLRVAELRREVQRCDDSILSLQIKVKKLEEEKDGNDGDKKPDLKDDAKAVKSRSNEIEPARLNRETTESDRDNRSMNESNSTASVDHERLRGDKTVQPCKSSRNPDPDPVNKAATEEEEEGTVSMRSGMSHSGELGESGTSTVPGKRKRKKYRSGEDNSIRGGSGNDIKLAGDKSQPLIEIVKLIRAHPRGSVFESRLRSQETKDYKRLIKQHLDIKTIEKKLKKGSYVSSSLCFYRDIKLLFTNAIVFFPPSSSESKAAHELRTLVSNEIKKQTGKQSIKTEPQSSVSKQKSSVPLPPSSLVVCKKKKSSVSKKETSPSSSSVKQKDEKKKSQDVSEEKKSVSNNGARSSNDVVVKDNKTGKAKNGNKKQTDSKTDSSSDDDDEKEERSKTEKKKELVGVTLDKKKKKSVADFLKRIKKNSPEKAKEEDDQKKQSDDGNVKKQSNGKAKPRELRSKTMDKKKVKVEDNSKKSSSKGKQSNETAEATTTGKRSRETGKEDKQPKKRSRR